MITLTNLNSSISSVDDTDEIFCFSAWIANNCLKLKRVKDVTIQSHSSCFSFAKQIFSWAQRLGQSFWLKWCPFSRARFVREMHQTSKQRSWTDRVLDCIQFCQQAMIAGCWDAATGAIKSEQPNKCALWELSQYVARRLSASEAQPSSTGHPVQQCPILAPTHQRRQSLSWRVRLSVSLWYMKSP